jgi:hypothetical protein
VLKVLPRRGLIVGKRMAIDATTLDATLIEAGMAVAELAVYETELRPGDTKANLAGIEELVADKGYLSGAVLKRVKSYGVRSYIPEKRQKSKRRWQGKAEEQKAVYGNRRRVRGEYGKGLLKRRREPVERSFAHCYETGGMRRCHLRGRKNILKRQLAHVSVFNLSLNMWQLLSAGTPRELKNRAIRLLLRLFLLITCLNRPNMAVEPRTSSALDSTGTYCFITPQCRNFWNSATCTTDR